MNDYQSCVMLHITETLAGFCVKVLTNNQHRSIPDRYLSENTLFIFPVIRQLLAIFCHYRPYTISFVNPVFAIIEVPFIFTYFFQIALTIWLLTEQTLVSVS